MVNVTHGVSRREGDGGRFSLVRERRRLRRFPKASMFFSFLCVLIYHKKMGRTKVQPEGLA
jgi:hypothetical protein